MTKTVFIHIPKNAGLSVVKIISGDKKYVVKQHIPIMINKNGKYLIDTEKLNINSFRKRYFSHPSYPTFCIIRNPYSRLLSAYNFLYFDGISNDIDTRYGKIIRSYESFEKFIDDIQNISTIIVHFVPQHFYVCDEEKNIIVDHVCKFENLKNDLVKVDNIFENIGHENVSKKIINSDSLTPEIKEKIYNVYKNDFEIFGYSA